jgi:hypothetical protein
MTVADVEAELLVELAPYLARVGLDSATDDGTNRSLRGPIRRAVLHLGFATAGPLAVADADLAPIVGWDVERFLDVARLRVLEYCWGNWPKVDFSAGGNSQSLDQLASRLERRIKELREQVARPYGPEEIIGPGGMAVGLIREGRCIPPGPADCGPGMDEWSWSRRDG